MEDYTECKIYTWLEIVYHGNNGYTDHLHVKRYEFGKWEKWGKPVIDPLIINQYERIYLSWLKEQHDDRKRPNKPFNFDGNYFHE